MKKYFTALLMLLIFSVGVQGQILTLFPISIAIEDTNTEYMYEIFGEDTIWFEKPKDTMYYEQLRLIDIEKLKENRGIAKEYTLIRVTRGIYGKTRYYWGKQKKWYKF